MRYLNCLLAFAISPMFVLEACKTGIKNERAKVDNEIDSPRSARSLVNNNKHISKPEDLYGLWVGLFVNASDSMFADEDEYFDEGLNWHMANKITLSIDSIAGSFVSGHTVVAGNYRPFSGTIRRSDTGFSLLLTEPGSAREDGRFSCGIKINDTTLSGVWNAYGKIDVPARRYKLVKQSFIYRPDQMLDSFIRYGNWYRTKKTRLNEDDSSDNYFFDKVASATDAIYRMNASTTLLKKSDLENLYAGDLEILRNTIYARHGYTFRHPAIRYFFDQQAWYIPVSADIRKDLSDTELANIRLLLSYEKNAKEYYDYFGR